MKELILNAPEIIKAASTNPLALMAFTILVMSILAYHFFYNSSESRKIAVFFGLMAFVIIAIVLPITITSIIPGLKGASSSLPFVTSSPSIAGIYTRLSKLLAAGQWKDADIETTKVMLQAAGREKEGWLDLNACRNFPPEELRTIDKLWLQYSNGRFGFSVQKKIWVEKGGKLDGSFDSDTYFKVADEVGWRKGGNWLSYDQITFNINAPAGHLPCGGLECGVVWCGKGADRMRAVLFPIL